MLVLLTIFAFLLLLTGLVLVHEWGHFIAARSAGVVVEEFGFGLPPRMKTLFKWKGTHFSLNWFPFGGFVRLKGENAIDAKARLAKGSFSAASVPARVMILVAGVTMNFLVAVVIFTVGMSVGKWVPTYLSEQSELDAAARGEIHIDTGVFIDDVLDGGTAQAAKLQPHSRLIAINGKAVTKPDDVLGLQKGKNSVTYTVMTGEHFTEKKEYVVAVQDGKTGVFLSPRAISAPVRGIFQGFALALREAGVVMYQTVAGMIGLFQSIARLGGIPQGITGIVGIYQYTSASVQEGFMVYLRLVALLSLSLACLNILPLPALDGGRLLFVLIEGISQRPPNRRFEMITNAVGFGVLLFLIVYVTFYDVLRLFS